MTDPFGGIIERLVQGAGSLEDFIEARRAYYHSMGVFLRRADFATATSLGLAYARLAPLYRGQEPLYTLYRAGLVYTLWGQGEMALVRGDLDKARQKAKIIGAAIRDHDAAGWGKTYRWTEARLFFYRLTSTVKWLGDEGQRDWLVSPHWLCRRTCQTGKHILTFLAEHPYKELEREYRARRLWLWTAYEVARCALRYCPAQYPLLGTWAERVIGERFPAAGLALEEADDLQAGLLAAMEVCSVRPSQLRFDAAYRKHQELMEAHHPPDQREFTRLASAQERAFMVARMGNRNLRLVERAG